MAPELDVTERRFRLPDEPEGAPCSFERMDRAEWEQFKRAGDRAFDEFEKRWPEAPPAESPPTEAPPAESP